jgi:hypothetical protein
LVDLLLDVQPRCRSAEHIASIQKLRNFGFRRRTVSQLIGNDFPGGSLERRVI